jgi:DNA invertase Pin-like site-specific DNA recombinase
MVIMHIAIYARVSTRDGRQDTENQLIQLREYARKQGWSVTKEYIDQASGGSTAKRPAKRPEFTQLMEDARTRQFDLVLFWALDRFSREGTLTTLSHLKRLTDAGVHWRSFTEQYLDSLGPFRDGVLAILACIAKQERTRISERVVAGLERAKRNGRYPGRPKSIVDVTKIQALRDQGLKWPQIASQLNTSLATVQRRFASRERETTTHEERSREPIQAMA